MKKSALNVIARLRQEGLKIYAAMGVEHPGRDLDFTLEEEVIEVYRAYVRRETAKALGVPVYEEEEGVEDDSGDEG